MTAVFELQTVSDLPLISFGCVHIWQALYSARRLVLADKANYDAIWTAELNDSSMSTAIDELGSLVQEIVAQTIAQPQQLNRLCSSAETRTLSLGGGSGMNLLPGVLGTVGRASSSRSVNSFTAVTSSGRWQLENLPDCEVEGAFHYLHAVDSLDQLYCQAVALNPLLIAKVQSWAHFSGGCFSSTATQAADDAGTCRGIEHEYVDFEDSTLPSGFVRWKDVQEQEQLFGGLVRWAKVKSVQRSIEKCTRSYGKVSTNK